MAENGLERDVDAMGFGATCAGGLLLFCAWLRAAGDGALVDAAARLRAATAAAEAALVWFDTFVHVLTVDDVLAEDEGRSAQEWSAGKRCCGQYCCLHDW